MHDIHVLSCPERGGRRSVARRHRGQALRGELRRLLLLGLLLALLAALAASPAGAITLRQENPLGGGSGSGDLAGDPDDGEHCFPVPEMPCVPDAARWAPTYDSAMVASTVPPAPSARFAAPPLAPRVWVGWLASLWSAGSPVSCPAWLVMWTPSSHR